MRKTLTTILLAAMATGGCQQGGGNGNQAAAAHRAEPAAKRNAAAAPAAKPASTCAPEPKLALAADFADPKKVFAPGTPAFRRTAENFSAAYRKSCATGLLRNHALMEPDAVQPDTLFLKNAPDANDAAIYRDGGQDTPMVRRVMVLEYPFVPADGAARIPTADDIGEAIYCAVQGATAKEENEDGRCLVD